MLVWEILLGTERAGEGARPPRCAPHPETLPGTGVFSGFRGQISLWALSKRSERLEYEGTKD